MLCKLWFHQLKDDVTPYILISQRNYICAKFGYYSPFDWKVTG